MAFPDLVALTDRAVQKHLGGVTVTYRPEFGAPLEVQAIFDAQFVLLDGDAGVETRKPVVFLRLEDLPDPPEEENPTITVADTDYQVVGRKPDNMGGIMLILHLVE